MKDYKKMWEELKGKLLLFGRYTYDIIDDPVLGEAYISIYNYMETTERARDEEAE